MVAMHKKENDNYVVAKNYLSILNVSIFGIEYSKK
jgi:hypothetical protein